MQDLRSGYGALPVLHGISFQVNRGETAVLLGLNGAGKSTTVLNLCGALRPWAGSITFDGEDSTQVVDGALCARGHRVGAGRTAHLSRPQRGEEPAGRLLDAAGRHRRWVEEQRERVYDYLPRLRERSEQMAGTLSGGEQQMLAIGRGLMAKPKLLIIDEASLGLAPVIVKEVFKIVSQVNDDGVTVILVEANISALEIADVGIVFQKGVITDELRGKQLRDVGAVRSLVLG